MILLNYTHPLTEEQQTQLKTLLGEVPEIRNVATQIDRSVPTAQAVAALADNAQLTPEEWQTTPLLLNPPALAPVATALIAEIHGRTGYFVPTLNVRPIAGSLPPRYEIAEIVALQEIRDAARERR
ncbi:MAG: hypothetical protein GFH27_549285n35 [Chloroflexi bacterium AL-W]|nr:hypothetical protein [Chloroflexi bacterium AL-N1]NOK65547.1 hypothetical protein [Chloroflexi bacterium AL-N10]NOK74511.1 hypothetical protein [Chloroflexi bacterium AL-N5]NOK80580.1 hypothetical protein [Chloroflexi bacterium AL-W]NOK88769.1 hypothetical protein [Chloroflexi bacterium AL-N15]